MIAATLSFLRRHLDEYLRLAMESNPAEPGADRVVFVDGDQMDPIKFKIGAVTALLVNIEEERLLRGADPYLRRGDDGQPMRVQPDIRLILHLTLVARFKQYEVAWATLSRIIEHLQSVRVFDAQDTPGLPPGVERLQLEFATLTVPEQNGIWSALRAPMHPAIHYRIKLLTFRDGSGSEAPTITSVEPSVKRSS